LEESFGGSSKNSTAAEVGNVLEYVCKFNLAQSRPDCCTSDRLYNVEQIALASIGAGCILDDSQESGANPANSLRLTIRPPTASNTLYDISLVTTDREFTSRGSTGFDVLERTTQSILVQDEFRSHKLVKDIETITSYDRVSPQKIIGTQRTATFLTPADPRFASLSAKNDRVKTSAVDIRRFIVTYETLLASS
jgi:hypothetical protein